MVWDMYIHSRKYSLCTRAEDQGTSQWFGTCTYIAGSTLSILELKIKELANGLGHVHT